MEDLAAFISQAQEAHIFKCNIFRNASSLPHIVTFLPHNTHESCMWRFRKRDALMDLRS
jgi:hypothetical protein